MTTLEQEAVTDPVKRDTLQTTRISHAETLETLRIIDHRAFTQRKHLEANSAGALLARLVRDRPEPPIITQICTPSGSLVHTQQEINEAFCTYLSTLYTAPT